MSGTHTPFPGTPTGDNIPASFLDDNAFFDSVLISQGTSGFMPGLFVRVRLVPRSDVHSDTPMLILATIGANLERPKRAITESSDLFSCVL